MKYISERERQRKNFDYEIKIKTIIIYRANNYRLKELYYSKRFR